MQQDVVATVSQDARTVQLRRRAVHRSAIERYAAVPNVPDMKEEQRRRLLYELFNRNHGANVRASSLALGYQTWTRADPNVATTPVRRRRRNAFPQFPCTPYQSISQAHTRLATQRIRGAPGLSTFASSAATVRRSSTQFNPPKLENAPSNCSLRKLAQLFCRKQAEVDIRASVLQWPCAIARRQSFAANCRKPAPTFQVRARNRASSPVPQLISRTRCPCENACSRTRHTCARCACPINDRVNTSS